MANRIRREVTAVGEGAALRRADLPSASGRGGRVETSDVAWLKPGAAAAWIDGLARPGFLVADGRLWLVAPAGKPGSVRFLDLSDPDSPWLQQVADLTGYAIGAELSEASDDSRGITVKTGDDLKDQEKPRSEDPRAARAAPERRASARKGPDRRASGSTPSISRPSWTRRPGRRTTSPC